MNPIKIILKENKIVILLTEQADFKKKFSKLIDLAQDGDILKFKFKKDVCVSTWDTSKRKQCTYGWTGAATMTAFSAGKVYKGKIVGSAAGTKIVMKIDKGQTLENTTEELKKALTTGEDPRRIIDFAKSELIRNHTPLSFKEIMNNPGLLAPKAVATPEPEPAAAVAVQAKAKPTIRPAVGATTEKKPVEPVTDPSKQRKMDAIVAAARKEALATHKARTKMTKDPAKFAALLKKSPVNLATKRWKKLYKLRQDIKNNVPGAAAKFAEVAGMAKVKQVGKTTAAAEEGIKKGLKRHFTFDKPSRRLVNLLLRLGLPYRDVKKWAQDAYIEGIYSANPGVMGLKGKEFEKWVALPDRSRRIDRKHLIALAKKHGLGERHLKAILGR